MGYFKVHSRGQGLLPGCATVQQTWRHGRMHHLHLSHHPSNASPQTDARECQVVVRGAIYCNWQPCFRQSAARKLWFHMWLSTTGMNVVWINNRFTWGSKARSSAKPSKPCVEQLKRPAKGSALRADTTPWLQTSSMVQSGGCRTKGTKVEASTPGTLGGADQPSERVLGFIVETPQKEGANLITSVKCFAPAAARLSDLISFSRFLKVPTGPEYGRRSSTSLTQGGQRSANQHLQHSGSYHHILCIYNCWWIIILRCTVTASTGSHKQATMPAVQTRLTLLR